MRAELLLRRVSTGVAAALLVAGLSMPPDVWAATNADAIKDAIRLRTSLGFPADLATVRAAALDSAAYPDEEFGIPLTVSEADEVRRRIAVQQSIGEAADYMETQATSAGFYFDLQKAGEPVFMFTDTSGQADQIRARLPKDTAFRIEHAAHSEAELLAVQAKVESRRSTLRSQGAVLVSTGLDTPANRVVVGVEDPAVKIDASSTVEASLQGDYGDVVRVEVDTPSVGDACTYDNCWLPEKAKGGIHVYKIFNQYPCTSAFIVRKAGTSNYGFITAGHCIEVNGGYGQTFKHGSSTVYTFGNSRYETWNNLANADAGIVDFVAAAVPNPKNTFHAGGGVVKSLISVIGHSGQGVGTFVCRSGRGTGEATCGNVVLKNVTRESSVGSTIKLIEFQFEVDFDSVGGDSGGPMYASNAGYGIHVHSDPDDSTNPHGWYSSLEFARSEYFNYSGGVTYNYCLSSTCSVTWP